MVRNSARALAAAALLPTLGACAGGGDAGGPAAAAWTTVVDTIGDTVRVLTRGGPAAPDSIGLVAEISIGVMDGADEYILGDPRSLGVTGDGRIVVLDAQVPVIRVYAPDGTWLHDIGREGGGPGEYDGPDAMAVTPDGRVLVRDPGNARISVFDPDGGLLDEWPHSGGFNTDRRYYVDAVGNSYTTILLERGLPPWEWKYGLVRYDGGGRVTDTLPAPVWDYEPSQITASREGSSSVRSVPFSPRPVWTFSPLGYFVGGLTGDYRIDQLRPDGTVLRFGREREAVPVARAEADEQRARITEGLQRQYGTWRWNGPPVPDTKPPFKELFVGEGGDVWVVLSSAGEPTMSAEEAEAALRETGRTPIRFAEPPALDVFGPDGRFLGPVRTPPELRVEPEPIVRGDRMWAVTRDAFDVATVTRFRIAR